MKYHDFRPSELRWGWNGLSFDRIDKLHASMLGVGKGINKSEYIILTQDGIDYGFLIEEIKYDGNPKDLFVAKLKIVGLAVD